MTAIDLIFCAARQTRQADIALEAGFLYGSQLPSIVHRPLYFADQNWKNPQRDKYMQDLARYRPHMATVKDLEHPEQREEVLDWAAEAAQFVNVVIIIPKVSLIHTLPKRIGNAEVRLGYSVPTKYGGTDLMVSEFMGWPVHLLGGSPGRQRHLATYMDVRSVDGNMAMAMANRFCAFWERGKLPFSNVWTKLDQSIPDRPRAAFRISCKNIMYYWQQEHG